MRSPIGGFQSHCGEVKYHIHKSHLVYVKYNIKYYKQYMYTTIQGIQGDMEPLKLLVPTEKMHTLKLENCVLFDRHTEDLSPGARLSDSSEELSQRGKGRARINRNLGKRGE